MGLHGHPARLLLRYIRPGATNTVTGIATAYMDPIPLVKSYLPGKHHAHR